MPMDDESKLRERMGSATDWLAVVAVLFWAVIVIHEYFRFEG